MASKRRLRVLRREREVMSMGKQNDNTTGRVPTRRTTLGDTAHSSRQRPGDTAESSFDPWSSWRTRRAEQFDAAEENTIRHLLAKTALLDKPKWRDAVGGDVAAAISIAVSFLPIDKLTVQIDIAMTALVNHAIEGDNAAAIVLSNILRNLPGSRPLHRRIATSWFVSNLATLTAVTHKLKSDTVVPATAVYRVERPARKGRALKRRRTASANNSGARGRNCLALHFSGYPEDAS
jgi:hypothetical protein